MLKEPPPHSYPPGDAAISCKVNLKTETTSDVQAIPFQRASGNRSRDHDKPLRLWSTRCYCKLSPAAHQLDHCYCKLSALRPPLSHLPWPQTSSLHSRSQRGGARA